MEGHTVCFPQEQILGLILCNAFINDPGVKSNTALTRPAEKAGGEVVHTKENLNILDGLE